jgi:hypothetical protein
LLPHRMREKSGRKSPSLSSMTRQKIHPYNGQLPELRHERQDHQEHDV